MTAPTPSPPPRPVHMPVTAGAAAEPPRWVAAAVYVARWRAEEGA